MSFQSDIFDFIKDIKGECNVLTVPRELINYTGDIESALLLSQLIYWTDKTKNPDGYIYKTYKEWEDEIWLNEYKVRKATNTLKKLGIIETVLKKANGAPTIHYKLDSVKFKESILEKLKNPILKNSSIESENFKESLTETTTEINTNTTTEATAPTIEPITDVLKYYRNNINPLPKKSEIDILFSFSDDLPDEVIIKAIDEAVVNNVRKINYIKAILNRWLEEGYKTVEEVAASKVQKSEKTSRHGSPQKTYGKVMRFNDYEQREYNYDELEKNLLYGSDEPEEETEFQGIDYLIKDKKINPS